MAPDGRLASAAVRGSQSNPPARAIHLSSLPECRRALNRRSRTMQPFNPLVGRSEGVLFERDAHRRDASLHFHASSAGAAQGAARAGEQLRRSRLASTTRERPDIQVVLDMKQLRLRLGLELKPS